MAIGSDDKTVPVKGYAYTTAMATNTRAKRASDQLTCLPPCACEAAADAPVAGDDGGSHDGGGSITQVVS